MFNDLNNSLSWLLLAQLLADKDAFRKINKIDK